jgi:YtkA-like
MLNARALRFVTFGVSSFTSVRAKVACEESATNRKLMLAAGIAVSIATSAVLAGANDYTFEPVKSEVKRGNGVTIAVRLVHKPTGKTITDAVIFSPRLDMSPDGMETMTTPVTPSIGAEPGIYSFKTDFTAAGRWLLTVSAKVQGEPETVIGRVMFKAID